MKRIVIATYGSAGDLFPLFPIADELREAGHEVTLAVPRFLGLQLRLRGIPHLTYGVSTQATDLAGSHGYTDRLGGWASWRRVFVDQIRPTLDDDLASVGALLDSWRPDTVVTTGLAVAARIATWGRGLAHVPVSLQPQFSRLTSTSRFAAPYLDAVCAVLPEREHIRKHIRLLAWGVAESGIVLHDPWLLRHSAVTTSGIVTGYPYWDDMAARPEDEEAAAEWCADTSTPVVLVSLGSYARRPEQWKTIVQTLRGSDVRLLNVNTGGELARTDRTLSVGYLPISRVVAKCAAVIHHGGLGTSFAALRAGRPAVVLADAFDQPFNASLLEHSGAGVPSTIGDLGATVRRVLADPATGRAAAAGAERLIPSAQAAAAAARRILTE